MLQRDFNLQVTEKRGQWGWVWPTNVSSTMQNLLLSVSRTWGGQAALRNTRKNQDNDNSIIKSHHHRHLGNAAQPSLTKNTFCCSGPQGCTQLFTGLVTSTSVLTQTKLPIGLGSSLINGDVFDPPGSAFSLITIITPPVSLCTTDFKTLELFLASY